MGRDDVIIKIGGKTFRCADCGANLFRKLADGIRYECNGCGAAYAGYAASEPAPTQAVRAALEAEKTR